MKKTCLVLVAAVLICAASLALAENISIDAGHFPDENFRAYVAEKIDENEDGILSDSERNAVYSMDVGERGIASLQGIAYFPRLQVLECNNNQLAVLDVSANPALYWLDCSMNQLTRLDVSANAALEWLGCSRNGLTALDVSANHALQRLYCNGNQLTSLNVSGNAALLELYCNFNGLSSLNVSACASLQRLDCSGNGLTSLDVSGNGALIGLWCGQNQLTSLNVSANAALRVLECVGNQRSVTAINGAYDLSALPGFDVNKASAWNGGAVAGTILTVPAAGSVTYSYDCGNGNSASFTLAVTVKPAVVIDAAHFPDANFRAYVAAEIDGDKDGILSDEERNAVIEIHANDKGIASLQGIAYFPNLRVLGCRANQLTSLNVSANPALQMLYCQSNQLTSLDVSANSSIQEVYCFGNAYSVSAQSGVYDLSALPGFDVTRASNWKGGTVNGTRLTVAESGAVTYTYNLGSGKSETFTLNVTVTLPPIAPGDVNGDGVIDGRDVLRLMKYQAGQAVQIDKTGSDVNGDGVIDGRDVLRLMKTLAGQ